MGRACGTYEGEERCIHGFGGETLSKMITCKKLAWMGSNIKIDPNETGWDAMEWINPAQDKGRCQALLNRVMSLWVP
jgi:hypothetical protein